MDTEIHTSHADVVLPADRWTVTSRDGRFGIARSAGEAIVGTWVDDEFLNDLREFVNGGGDAIDKGDYRIETVIGGHTYLTLRSRARGLAIEVHVTEAVLSEIQAAVDERRQAAVQRITAGLLFIALVLPFAWAVLHFLFPVI